MFQSITVPEYTENKSENSPRACTRMIENDACSNTVGLLKSNQGAGNLQSRPILAAFLLLRESFRISRGTRGNGLPTRGNGLPTRGNGLPTRGNDLPTRANGLQTRGNDLPTRANGLQTRGEPAVYQPAAMVYQPAAMV